MTSCWHTGEKKGKGSPYSITERRVPELIPVLCSQPAGDVSHTPGGRMSLLSARPAVILAIQGCYQFCCLVNRGKTVNSLPKSSTLTTRLPSHPDTQWLGIGDARRGYTHNYSTGGSTDLTLRRVLKLANQRAAPARGRSLLSTIALFLFATDISRHNYAVERGLVVGFCGRPHYCCRPYYPTARFQSPSSYIVFDEPFPDESRPM